MADRSRSRPVVRLLADPDVVLAAHLAMAGLHAVGRIGVAEVWVDDDRAVGAVA